MPEASVASVAVTCCAEGIAKTVFHTTSRILILIPAHSISSNTNKRHFVSESIKNVILHFGFHASKLAFLRNETVVILFGALVPHFWCLFLCLHSRTKCAFTCDVCSFLFSPNASDNPTEKRFSTTKIHLVMSCLYDVRQAAIKKHIPASSQHTSTLSFQKLCANATMNALETNPES